MSDFEFTRGLDPVPAEEREADPDRAARARKLEPLITAEIHADYDEEFHPRQRKWEQRVHYITCPAEHAPPQRTERINPESMTSGFIYWLAGAWFWRPYWDVDDPSVVDLEGADQEPSVKLEVETEEEAILHARRRVAWELAG